MAIASTSVKQTSSAATPDPLHRCTLAHYMADLHEHPATALIWDVGASMPPTSSATIEPSSTTRACMSLVSTRASTSNLADNLRRLGAFDAAIEYINNAEQHTESLRDDAYGDMLRAAIVEIRQAIDNCDTTRRASDPGAVP